LRIPEVEEQVARRQDEVVVITGATAGVGRAVVREFAKRRASIGLIARGKDCLKETKEEVEQQGGRALALSVDVANSDQVEQAAEQIERELGPINIWVNDAMTTIFAPISAIQPDEFRRATEVTYLGCVYGTMAALKGMIPATAALLSRLARP
jgi:NADP-dependent 3-hydroxy acid dehydrogenase YdfG